jgi:hypothetical protein
MKHFDPRELDKDPVREHLRRQHAANVAECAPLLDRSIPLGTPTFSDRFEINNYYREKHRHGEVGRFWPLHKIQTPGR